MSEEGPSTREDAPDEMICKDCHRYVGEEDDRCEVCRERRRAGF